MKIKSIKKALEDKFNDFVTSIDDHDVSEAINTGSIITGGCIPSMLLREEVNDFDIYFRDRDTAIRVAQYYVKKFCENGPKVLEVDTQTPDRVRIIKPTFEDQSKSRGESAGDLRLIQNPGEIEDTYQETEKMALESEDADKPKYRPVFLTNNAITLSHRVQLVLRFYGEPEEIHANYDFVHCMNYWTSWDEKLVLKQGALESILTKELRYVGSKYPVCSVMRLRKFIARGWTVNAGQVLKMIMQMNELDLTIPSVLEDQLTGVDSAYFCDLMKQLKDKDPAKVNSAYLCEIIDRIF